MPMMAAQVRAMAAGAAWSLAASTATSTAMMSSALVVRAAWAALAPGSSSQNQASRGTNSQFGPLAFGHRWPVSMTVALSSLVMPRS